MASTAGQPPGAAPPGGKGRKVMGLTPTMWLVVLGIALVGGGYILYRHRKSAATSQAASTVTTGGCPQGYAVDASGNCQPVTSDYSGQIGTLQTEIMDMQSSEAQDGTPAPAKSTAPAQDFQWISTGGYTLNVVALSHRTSPEAIVQATQEHGAYGGIFESYVNKGNYNAKIPIGAIMWIPQYTPAPVAVYAGESYTGGGLAPEPAGGGAATGSPGGGSPGGSGAHSAPSKPASKKPPARPAAHPARKAAAHHTVKKK